MFLGVSGSGAWDISRDLVDLSFHRRLCAAGWLGAACSAGLCHDVGVSCVPVLFPIRTASLPTRYRLSLRRVAGSIGDIRIWVLA